MAFEPFLAIRFTPYFAHTTGWCDRFGRVFAVLGFRTRNPTAREFVTAVRAWQLDHPPLDADGILGPHTWDVLLPAVRAYTGVVPAGTRPDWVGPAAAAGGGGADPPPPAAVVDPVGHTAEDRALRVVIAQWLRLGGKPEANPYVAVPVSTGYAAADARACTPTLPTGGVCGDLRVGQVWPGLAGNRVIVSLIPVAPPAAGAVVFVTDSGQAYYQTVEGWSLDNLAGVYAGTALSLSAIQTLRDLEVEALLGALTASRGVVFAAGAAATGWVLEHRDDIARYTAAFGPIAAALADLRRVAPAVFGGLIGGFFRRLTADIPTPDITSPKAVARFVGGVLIRFDRPTLVRNASTLADALAAVAKRVVVGDTVRDAAARGGVVLNPDEVDRILGEVRTAPTEIKRLIDQLRGATLSVR
jgi:hypothetical protein